MNRISVAALSLVASLAAGIALSGVRAQAPAAQTPTQAPAAGAQQFMLLPYETRSQIAARNGEKAKEYWASWAAYTEKLVAAGVLSGGSALEAPGEARTVRAANATKSEVRPGAFQNGAEQLSGYLTLRVRSRDEAVRWAEQCPAATTGGVVEVRPMIATMASQH